MAERSSLIDSVGVPSGLGMPEGALEKEAGKVVDISGPLFDAAGEASSSSNQPFTLQTITREEIDRVGEVLLGEVDKLTTQVREGKVGFHCGDHLREIAAEGRSAVTEKDRVALMCWVAKARDLLLKGPLGSEQLQLFLAYGRAMEIARENKCLNDRVWDGGDSSPRGKLLMTLAPRDEIFTLMREGVSPFTVDCEGESGMQRLQPPQVEPAVGLDRVTVDDLDRIVENMGKAMAGLVRQFEAGDFGDDMGHNDIRHLVRQVSYPVEEKDRVAFTSMVARAFSQWQGTSETLSAKECFELRCIAFKGYAIMLDKGWINDLDCNGQLLATVAPKIIDEASVAMGLDPSLPDSFGVTGFSLMPAEESSRVVPVFVQFGNQQRVIQWLSELSREELSPAFVKGARVTQRTEVVAWLEANS